MQGAVNSNAWVPTPQPKYNGQKPTCITDNVMRERKHPEIIHRKSRVSSKCPENHHQRKIRQMRQHGPQYAKTGRAILIQWSPCPRPVGRQHRVHSGPTPPNPAMPPARRQTWQDQSDDSDKRFFLSCARALRPEIRDATSHASEHDGGQLLDSPSPWPSLRVASCEGRARRRTWNWPACESRSDGVKAVWCMAPCDHTQTTINTDKIKGMRRACATAPNTQEGLDPLFGSAHSTVTPRHHRWASRFGGGGAQCVFASAQFLSITGALGCCATSHTSSPRGSRA